MDLIATIQGIGAMIELADEKGIDSIVIAIILIVGYKYAMKQIDKKTSVSEDKIKKTREINDNLDRKENERSKEKIKAVQRYLEKNSKDFFDNGIDRVSVFLNHNGTRNNEKIHFLYYSLVADVANQGLEKFSQFQIKLEKLPYFMFSEYEEKVITGEGCAFIPDVNDLGPTAREIALHSGAKSMCIKALHNKNGSIAGLVFGSSVFKKLEESPTLENHIENLNLIYNAA